MSRIPRVRFGSTLALALGALAVSSPPAGAQAPEFVGLGGGEFPQLASTWQANAVVPNTTLLDLYDSTGILYQSYSSIWEPQRKVGLVATGQRPLGLPSTAALVAGAAGTKVRTVKVFFLGAPMQRVRTVVPPPEWGFRGRFFAAGTTLDPSAAATTEVVTRLKGLDRRGRRLVTVDSVFTNPF